MNRITGEIKSIRKGRHTDADSLAYCEICDRFFITAADVEDHLAVFIIASVPGGTRLHRTCVSTYSIVVKIITSIFLIKSNLRTQYIIKVTLGAVFTALLVAHIFGCSRRHVKGKHHCRSSKK